MSDPRANDPIPLVDEKNETKVVAAIKESKTAAPVATAPAAPPPTPSTAPARTPENAVQAMAAVRATTAPAAAPIQAAAGDLHAVELLNKAYKQLAAELG